MSVTSDHLAIGHKGVDDRLFGRLDDSRKDRIHPAPLDEFQVSDGALSAGIELELGRERAGVCGGKRQKEIAGRRATEDR